jgi:hypothetical protein
MSGLLPEKFKTVPADNSSSGLVLINGYNQKEIYRHIVSCLNQEYYISAINTKTANLNLPGLREFSSQDIEKHSLRSVLEIAIRHSP